ncbi:MAG: hypothetical protein MJZ43_00925 [Bacteroidaceae bacterium]|nr:hypothetical protein [Candidatus Equimonas faecalis]MCQ2205326.1 hypothetical protein [Bacteroidaceae bacterium]
MPNLNDEFNYYLEHQKELLQQYSGKFLVIMGQEVVGVYSDRADAYYSSLEKYAPGTFLIQLCTPGDSAYTVRYYNRVSPVSVAPAV